MAAVGQQTGWGWTCGAALAAAAAAHAGTLTYGGDNILAAGVSFCVAGAALILLQLGSSWWRKSHRYKIVAARSPAGSSLLDRARQQTAPPRQEPYMGDLKALTGVNESVLYEIDAELRRRKEAGERPAPIVPAGATCASCGRAGVPLQCCARCKSLWVCSHKCQKAAWKWHKKTCQDALAVLAEGCDAARSVSAAARTLSSLAEAARLLGAGDAHAAREQAAKSLQAAREAGSVERQVDALQFLGQVCLQLGDIEGADEAYQAMEALGKETGNPAIEGDGLIGRGCAACRTKAGVAAGLTFQEQAIELAKRASAGGGASDAVVSMEASARANRGRCLSAMGRTKEAISELRQVVALQRLGLAINATAKRRRRLGISLINLASAEVNQPNGEATVKPLLREALAIAKETKDHHLQQIVVTNLQAIGEKLSEEDLLGVTAAGAGSTPLL